LDRQKRESNQRERERDQDREEERQEREYERRQHEYARKEREDVRDNQKRKELNQKRKISDLNKIKKLARIDIKILPREMKSVNALCLKNNSPYWIGGNPGTMGKKHFAKEW